MNTPGKCPLSPCSPPQGEYYAKKCDRNTKISIILSSQLINYIYMMLLDNKQSQKSIVKGLKSTPFDTEMSHDGLVEDKQFSPWVKMKGKKMLEQPSPKLDIHQFLAKIKFQRKKQTTIEPYENQKSTVRRSLQSRIKDSKIHNRDYIEIMKTNRKVIQEKSYFQKRSKLGHVEKKLKNIQLSLDIQGGKFLKTSPYFPRSTISHSPQTNKKQQKIPKNKKQLRIPRNKHSKDEKQFADTMKDFHKSLMKPQRKLFKTLQLNVYPLTERSIYSREQKEERVRFTSLNNRSRYNSPSRLEKDEDSNQLITCQGKNLLSSTSYGKTRRQKLRKQLQQKTMKEVIFLK